MADWWDTRYLYRRRLAISSDSHAYYDNFVLEAGHPIEATLPYADMVETNKVRPDFRDIEVLYLTKDIVPQWVQLVSDVVPSVEADTLVVRFLLKAQLGTESDYYIYYGNEYANIGYPSEDVYPSIYYFPEESVYSFSAVSSLWPIQVGPSDTKLDYSRKLDHWNVEPVVGIPGVYADTAITKDIEAQVSLEFHGTAVQIRSIFGPNYGLAEVILGQDLPVLVDLYSPELKVDTCFSAFKLNTDSVPRITFRATGKRNPVSVANDVNIIGIDFLHQYFVDVSGEMVEPSIKWEASSGGGG